MDTRLNLVRPAEEAGGNVMPVQPGLAEPGAAEELMETADRQLGGWTSWCDGGRIVYLSTLDTVFPAPGNANGPFAAVGSVAGVFRQELSRERSRCGSECGRVQPGPAHEHNPLLCGQEGPRQCDRIHFGR